MGIELKGMLDKRFDLQKYLFCRGFLFTNKQININVFPFYGHWNETNIGSYTAYTHELQQVTVIENGGKYFFLFGHAYNPFSMKICETDVLARIASSYGTNDYWDWYKHFGRTSFPKLSPKLFRNLYKIFLNNRGLAHKVDKIFAQYIKKFEYESMPASYPITDIYYNEVTWGSWGGPNISEMKLYSDITFVYNNRKFLDLMFRVPLEKRISDRHHIDMKKLLNSDLYDMNIRVVNLKETDFRALMLNIIFTLNMLLP